MTAKVGVFIDVINVQIKIKKLKKQKVGKIYKNKI